MSDNSSSLSALAFFLAAADLAAGLAFSVVWVSFLAAGLAGAFLGAALALGF